MEDLKKIGVNGTDLDELRLDYLESLDSFSLDHVERYKSRLILTLREPAEGGVHAFSVEEKLKFLNEAARRGFRVDVEGEFADKHGFDCAGQIVSMHCPGSEPSYAGMARFIERYREIAEVTKLAVKSGKSSRVNLIRLLGKYHGIAVMETDGEGSSRLLFSILGSKLLYCHAGERTSPGQLSCEEALGVLDALESQP